MSKCLRCGAGSEWLEGKVPTSTRFVDEAVTENAKLRKQNALMAELLGSFVAISPKLESKERIWRKAYSGYVKGANRLLRKMARSKDACS